MKKYTFFLLWLSLFFLDRLDIKPSLGLMVIGFIFITGTLLLIEFLNPLTKKIELKNEKSKY